VCPWADDAELVALGIGQHDPRLLAGLADVDAAGAERQDALDLRVPVVGAGGEIEMEAVLGGLLIGQVSPSKNEVAGWCRGDTTKPGPSQHGGAGTAEELLDAPELVRRDRLVAAVAVEPRRMPETARTALNSLARCGPEVCQGAVEPLLDGARSESLDEVEALCDFPPCDFPLYGACESVAVTVTVGEPAGA
jgi:hypothetical protein